MKKLISPILMAATLLTTSAVGWGEMPTTDNGVSEIDIRRIRPSEENRMAAIIKYQSGHFVVVHYYSQRSNPPEWVAVLGLDGTETFRCTPAFSLPDDSNVQIRDAAVNSRGRLAVCVYAESGSGQRSSVVLVYDISAKSGTSLRLIRAFPISVNRVAVDVQNNIWVLGPNMQVADAHQDYGCVHKFSAEGQLLGSYLPRSTLPMLDDTGRRTEPWFYAAGKPGWPELFADGHGGVYAWLPAILTVVGLDSDGAVTSRSRLDPSGLIERKVDSVAVQPNGVILAILASGLSEFDRASGTWHPIVKASGPADLAKISTSEVAADTWSSLSESRYSMVGADDGAIAVRDRTDRDLIRVQFQRPLQQQH